MFFAFLFIVLGYLGYRGYKLGYFSPKVQTPAAPEPVKYYPGTLVGSFTMPSHEARIAARNTSLVNHGHTVTGDDSIDNAVLGGGSPDGGIWLSGHYAFEIDANGQKTDKSWITVFSDEHFPVTGGVMPDGKIGMASPAGVSITGQIIGNTVVGKVCEAGMIAKVGSIPGLDGNPVTRDGEQYLEYVHGAMTGTFTPNGKL
jgi:hypothetical protein